MGVTDEQTVFKDTDKMRITLREDNLIVSSLYVSKFPKPGHERWQLYHSSEGSIRKLVISQVIE